MNQRFRIDGAEYDMQNFTQEVRNLVAQLNFTILALQELSNQQALFMKAKNAYIADLKSEIVKGRTGLDLGAMFSDD
jgi:hypothetical protein